jgi:hypothetical protein
MSHSRYDSIVCPDTGRRVALTGSRVSCSACGRAFSGVDAFDRHRVGPYEPDERRCLTPAEMVEKGLFRKPSGVWGRRARTPRPAGIAGAVPDGDVGARAPVRRPRASDSDGGGANRGGYAA